MYSNSKCNKFLMYFIFIIFLFCSCQTFYPKNSPEFSFIENSGKNFVWEKLTEGIFLSHIKYEDYPLIVHAVKIDLTNPKLKIVVTEPALFNSKGMVKRETTLSFARRHNTVIALNAAFFNVISFSFSLRGEPLGIHIDKKINLSKPFPKYGALCFLDDNSAFIIESQNKEDIKADIEYAVSGNRIILKNGKPIITNISKKENSRTCVGLADGGKTLYLFFAEGENKKKSRGITYDQAHFFMKKLGAQDAIHLDGGGSSSLIIKKENSFFVQVPSISHFGLRKVVTNLGFIIED
ncbi:phosphodiester glycosidase family protein [Treponema denticola]|uniref:phosphodiester glycosidase family protein n=1 Tax=Treponema denticola TaxID=158 RepID=UPI003D532873